MWRERAKTIYPSEECIEQGSKYFSQIDRGSEAGNAVGAVRMRSIFRNQYSITVDGLNEWTFRMPLYTVRFYGESNAGAEMWVVLGPSKTEWCILIKRGVTEKPLVAALAFIHTEWWNYG